MNKQKRMEELVIIINEASNAYYNEDREIMSNYEYDALYDELLMLEKETGIVLENSPTTFAGYIAMSKLKKSEHKHPALSLDKTKDRESLVEWLKTKKGVLSWKLDGLTIVATYNKGKLVQAVTRGNGYIGEDITHNAKFFKGLPNKINYQGNLIVRGEAVMTYEEFERINSVLPESVSKYKNPRNLASATVRMLDAKESSEREIFVYAFDLVHSDEIMNSKSTQFEWLKSQGFSIVEYQTVTPETIVETIGKFERKMIDNEFPSDGLVLIYDDEQYGKSLGMTGKFPRNGIAFKWQDTNVETKLLSIEWSASRTGLLNPVAVFEPVEIEGTTVERASIHNVSIAKSLRLGIGSTINVYKANLIIPQIAETLVSTGETQIPDKCPICGGKTVIKTNDGIETLYCENPKCVAKNIGRFTHFVSRDCMNIVGLSEATIEKFIAEKYLENLDDIYHLYKCNDIIDMDGFGEKSFDNLIDAIEKSRQVKFSAFLHSLGIAGIGKDMAKQISKYLGKDAFHKFVERLRMCEEFTDIEGIGEVINDNIYKWKADAKLQTEFANLVDELDILDDISEVKESTITNKTFVITGSLSHFPNRDSLKAYIESLGGKTSGTVSAKTDYLINNDINSTSGKNKKAKELGVKIINEEMFLKLVE